MIDLAQVRKLSPQHGDIIAVPVETSDEDARQLAEALHLAAPGVRAIVVRGDIRKLSAAEMNAAGWYRA